MHAFQHKEIIFVQLNLGHVRKNIVLSFIERSSCFRGSQNYRESDIWDLDQCQGLLYSVPIRGSTIHVSVPDAYI